VKTGANGYIWVRMGALGCRGHKGHKNKADRGYLGSKRSEFGSYGRGNFPGHDVFWHLPKMPKYGCRWVNMDVDGCEWTYGQGGRQKQGKKNYKLASRERFATHAQSAKNKQVARDGHGDQR